MPNTLAYHLVKSGYGLWLPGDDRGSWSEAWDKQIGFIEPHTLHPGDPVRKRMATERMKHPPVRMTAAMMVVTEDVLTRCASESPWQILAGSIEPTHTHLLITYSRMDIDKTAKWLADQTTKAIHKETEHTGPVWAKGKWRSFIFDETALDVVRNYIERHNIRRGESSRPYRFL